MEDDSQMITLHWVSTARHNLTFVSLTSRPQVFVCGMPHEFSETELRAYWGFCGEIEALDCLSFADSGRFNGVCFITFKSVKGYDAAMGVNGDELQGRNVRVSGSMHGGDAFFLLAQIKGRSQLFPYRTRTRHLVQRMLFMHVLCCSSLKSRHNESGTQCMTYVVGMG